MATMAAIRQAIASSGKTLYRISNDLGWNESYFGKVVNGKAALSVERLDALADYLGLEIQLRAKGAKRGKRNSRIQR